MQPYSEHVAQRVEGPCVPRLRRLCEPGACADGVPVGARAVQEALSEAEGRLLEVRLVARGDGQAVNGPRGILRQAEAAALQKPREVHEGCGAAAAARTTRAAVRLFVAPRALREVDLEVSEAVAVAVCEDAKATHVARP